MNKFFIYVLFLGLSCGGVLSPANAQKVLFADNFNRSDNTDLNASAVGKAGTLGMLDWIEVSSGSNEDPVISSETLILGEAGGATGGWSIACVDRNFIDVELVESGEFTVNVDIAGISEGGGTRFSGLAIGHSLSEINGWSANVPSGFSSDFFFGYDNRGTREIKVFIHGGIEDYQQTINLDTGAELSVRFSGISNFNAGSSINYEAFVNGTSVKTGSFVWSGTGENYIALYSNYSGGNGVLDNFEVSTPERDDDGDGLPNWWESQYFGSPLAANPGEDVPDGDGLTNLEEFNLGTDPTLTDSDSDGLDDPVETATGIWVDATDTGTNPASDDTDDDGLGDGAETNTGIYVSANDTGTNPLLWDTDGDGFSDGIELDTGVFVDASDPGTSPLLADTDQDGAGDWYEVIASLTDPLSSADRPGVPYPLPDPDPLDTGVGDRPVKVYIMAGQSNMVGFGTVSGEPSSTLESMTLRQNTFPNLIDGSGDWTTRADVRYRGVIADVANTLLSPGLLGPAFGPELGFGYMMGWYHDEPVLLIKASAGGRSLAFDILPPGSPAYEYDGRVYAGYGEGPAERAIGEEPALNPTEWAGHDWDRFFIDESEFVRSQNAVTNVVDVLDNFATDYPGWASQGFEIAGFVWWQGDADRYEASRATRYEENLTRLILELRNYYETRYPGKVVENAPFVLATLGQTPLDETDLEERAILDGQLAVDGDAGNYPEFVGNVKTVYAHPLSQGGASNGHYNGHAMTYMLVGDALGAAMVELLESSAGEPGTFQDWIDGFPKVGALDGWNEDADGDGVFNAVENYLGTDPDTFTPGLVIETVTLGGSSQFSFSHPINEAPASDLTAAYQWSTNLSAFHEDGATDLNGTTVSFSVGSPVEGEVTITATITGHQPDRLFVTVAVSPSP